MRDGLTTTLDSFHPHLHPVSWYPDLTNLSRNDFSTHRGGDVRCELYGRLTRSPKDSTIWWMNFFNKIPIEDSIHIGGDVENENNMHKRGRSNACLVNKVTMS